eukprot:scaffold90465_cov13-Tisochrysis_lutea.AAC.1
MACPSHVCVSSLSESPAPASRQEHDEFCRIADACSSSPMTGCSKAFEAHKLATVRNSWLSAKSGPTRHDPRPQLRP